MPSRRAGGEGRASSEAETIASRRHMEFEKELWPACVIGINRKSTRGSRAIHRPLAGQASRSPALQTPAKLEEISTRVAGAVEDRSFPKRRSPPTRSSCSI